MKFIFHNLTMSRFLKKALNESDENEITLNLTEKKISTQSGEYICIDAKESMVLTLDRSKIKTFRKILKTIDEQPVCAIVKPDSNYIDIHFVI